MSDNIYNDFLNTIEKGYTEEIQEEFKKHKLDKRHYNAIQAMKANKKEKEISPEEFEKMQDEQAKRVDQYLLENNPYYFRGRIEQEQRKQLVKDYFKKEGE